MVKKKLWRVSRTISLVFAFLNIILLIITIVLQKKTVPNSTVYILIKMQICFLVISILSEFVYWILSLVIKKEYVYEVQTVFFIILVVSNLLIPNLSIPHYYNKVSLIHQVYSDNLNSYGPHQSIYQERNPTVEEYDILFVEKFYGEPEIGYLYSIDDTCDIKNTGLWFFSNTNIEHIWGNWYKVELEFYP